ncbi:3-deoxy-D-manno-octulosonic acid transferase [Falsirhodobacter algicola]|uniref:3-deoxy-D-manno-octulosonic acid transferase n=1 Tax=Falsirhodobacter algicola TaxID=2692330 RepID=A0A8J8MRI5_9RHOB|nr:glycosyltransferase N-terminal domain-containing protein [Falsirhodobacter algicola]QUS34973.1 3-deoxy-D-manno-octulosonic acid transferase [Falsirhodobacter algicola]
MTLYRLLMLAALPVLALLALRRGTLAQRMGRGPWPEGALWLHGASNGEITSARAVIERLSRAAPVVVTCNNPTARALVQGWALPGVTARLAPFDLPWPLARILRRRPRALIVVENELWPERILGCAARGVPVFVIGAKMSERSARRWGRIGLARRILGALTWVSAQDAGGEARLRALGLPADRIGPRLMLKAAVETRADPLPPAPVPRAETLLAASTHEGEEEAILDAFARQSRFRWLILAPRHPARGAAVAALAEARGMVAAQRSAGAAPGGAVYVADTMGEMHLWYRMAAATVIGGTFTDRGGHTPYEPAAYGSAILHGPDVANFADVFARLDAEGGAIPVRADLLAEALDALSDPGAVARQAERLADRGDAARIASEAILSRLA